MADSDSELVIPTPVVDTGAEAGPDPDAWTRAVAPTINKITFSDVFTSLGLGLRDLLRAPVYGLAVGIFYALGGIGIYLLANRAGMFYLAYPLAAGFALIGPFFAIALYEVSRRLETGEPLSMRSVFGVVTGPGSHSLGWMPMLNLFAFFLWVDVAAALYFGFFGLRHFDLASLLTELMSTSSGLIFIAVGNLAGAIFALLIFSTTVVAYPLLLDRNADFVTAISASVKSVRTNLVPMLGFGFIVGVLMFLAILPALVGLIIVLPILGHATWHLYRRVVSWPQG